VTVVTVISDGCADPVEGVHDFMQGKILNNRGYVITAAEFQEGFAKATGTSYLFICLRFSNKRLLIGEKNIT